MLGAMVSTLDRRSHECAQKPSLGIQETGIEGVREDLETRPHNMVAHTAIAYLSMVRNQENNPYVNSIYKSRTLNPKH